jgi:glucose 1-dehydrogenase
VTSNTDRYKPNITPVADRLQGKVALITGGAMGIGRAIALRFAQEGADIAIADINVESGQKTARDIQDLGCKCVFIETDVSDRVQVEQMIAKVTQRFHVIDVLVNNAGIIAFGSILECRIEDWDRMLAIDLTGALHCAQIVGKFMIERNEGGRMIHVGSTASLLPTGQQGAYCVAKAGLSMLSMMASMELAPYGITSNLLCPEGAVTDINRELLRDPKIMSELESRIPLGRLSTSEEIAAAAAFLASDEAAYITGVELVHDGGVTKSALWWR